MEKTQAIAEIIATEMARDYDTRAGNMRAAAMFAMEDFPGVTSSEFGDAAALKGFHRQSAMNRFNEAAKDVKEMDGQ